MPCPFCGIIILEENVFVVAGGGVHEVNLVGHRHFVVFAGEVVVNDASASPFSLSLVTTGPQGSKSTQVPKPRQFPVKLVAIAPKGEPWRRPE